MILCLLYVCQHLSDVDSSLSSDPCVYILSRKTKPNVILLQVWSNENMSYQSFYEDKLVSKGIHKKRAGDLYSYSKIHKCMNSFSNASIKKTKVKIYIQIVNCTNVNRSTHNRSADTWRLRLSSHSTFTNVVFKTGEKLGHMGVTHCVPGNDVFLT